MSEPQPEYVWAFPPEKPKRAKVWLIVVLAVVAVAIAATAFLLIFRPGTPGAGPTSKPSTSPSASVSPSASPSASATVTPTPTASASSAPPSTAPAPGDPNLAVFRDKVAPVLNDGERGLDIAQDADAQEAAQTIGFLQDDAGRLADSVAPSSIATRWTSAVNTYAKTLQTLRSAYERGSAAEQESNAARSALSELNDIVSGR